MATIESISQLGLTFFGLTYDIAPQARAAVFTQIHEIVFHGKGGYDWHTIYNMPIWLRRFTFNKIQEFYTSEKEAYENKGKGGNTKTVIDANGKIKAPDLLKNPNSSTPNRTASKNPAKYK
jgi:hypothetical protein